VRPGSLRTRALVGVLALVAALALPAAALAASPFGGLSTPTTSVPATTTQTATTAAPVTVPSTTTSGGLSTLDVVGIAVVAFGVFATIIYVIRSDARAHAPRHATRDIDRERATVAPRADRIKRSRAKAKAARRARKARR
jgi:hypothetical protein